MAKRPTSAPKRERKTRVSTKDCDIARTQIIKAIEGLDFEDPNDREIMVEICLGFDEIETTMEIGFVPEGIWCCVEFKDAE